MRLTVEEALRAVDDHVRYCEPDIPTEAAEVLAEEVQRVRALRLAAIADILEDALDCPFAQNRKEWEAWCAMWRPRAQEALKILREALA